MTAFEIAAACLVISISFAAVAAAVEARTRGSRPARPKGAPYTPRPHQRSDEDIASSLEGLGWTVEHNKNGYQFSATTKLPDMREAAAFFRQLDKPFQLQLQGLENLNGLRFIAEVPTCAHIAINGGETTDASELSGFTHLETLHWAQLPLNKSADFDASFLKELVNLTELNLHSTRINSAEFLSGMEKLETLNLRDTLVGDLSPLAELGSLRSVDITGTPIYDLRPLQQSQDLRELGVGGSQLAGLATLAHLDKLKDLRIIEQGEVDLTEVGSLASLQSLMLWGPPQVDLLPLRQLANLQSLQIGGIGVKGPSIALNADALGELGALKRLALSSLSIQDIGFVAALTQLEELDIHELPVASVEPLRGHASLKTISLVDVPLADISPLTDMPSLAELNITRTPARSDSLAILEGRGVVVTVN